MKQKVIRSCSYVGKETLAIAFSCSISFVNLINGHELYYRATDANVGHGVACIASHISYNIFAFAEVSLHPRIMLYNFPDFKQINILESKI